MNIELTNKDLGLLKVMLNKELGDTRVEIIHTGNLDYKHCLKDREKEVRSLLKRVSADKSEAPSY